MKVLAIAGDVHRVTITCVFKRLAHEASSLKRHAALQEASSLKQHAALQEASSLKRHAALQEASSLKRHAVLQDSYSSAPCACQFASVRAENNMVLGLLK